MSASFNPDEPAITGQEMDTPCVSTEPWYSSFLSNVLQSVAGTLNVNHPTRPAFICETCSKTFKRISSLKMHRRLHSGQKEYVCPECHKQFFQKGNLEIHMLTHSAACPYQCTICSKTFNQKSNLKVHQQRRHSIKISPMTYSVRWSCSQCNSSFAKKTLLSKHERDTGHRQIIKRDASTGLDEMSFVVPAPSKILQQVQDRKAIPLVEVKFLEGEPKMCRVVQVRGGEMVVRPVKGDDLGDLTAGENVAMTVIAFIYQSLDENGRQVFVLQPPRKLAKAGTLADAADLD